MIVIVIVLAVACAVLALQAAALVDQVRKVRAERDHERRLRIAETQRANNLDWLRRAERTVAATQIDALHAAATAHQEVCRAHA